MPNVRSYYERAWGAEAGSVEGEAIVLERRRREAIGRSLELLRPVRGLRVLEVGPGRGAMAARLAADGARLVVADLARSALRRTRAAAPAARAVEADLERLPFRAGAFDRVYVNSLLMFVDPDRALEEIARVLDSDGRAVVVEPLSGNPLMAAYRAVAGRYRGIARWHRLERLRSAFDRRFGIVELEPFYLVPPACLLEGAGRRAARAADAFLLALVPALGRLAWLVVARLERPHAARPRVDTAPPAA